MCLSDKNQLLLLSNIFAQITVYVRFSRNLKLSLHKATTYLDRNPDMETLAKNHARADA